MREVHPQVARALALHPLLLQEGDEFNRERKLTPSVVQALKDGNFFRMLQPRSIGGMEMKPSDFSRVTEALARADGSTAWVVCQGNGCSMTSAYLDPRVAKEMFGPTDGILAWGPLHLRHMALCQRQPERHLARCAYEGEGAQGDAHHAVPEVQRDDGGHLAHAGFARNGQQ